MSKTRELSQPVEADNGERVLLGTRRPDGTVRKERRIRAGYTPQDEQPVYQSRGVLARQNVPVCPGMDPEMLAKEAVSPGNTQDSTRQAAKPSKKARRTVEAKQAQSKAQKKNEKRKEKKEAPTGAGSSSNGQQSSAAPVQAVTAQMGKLNVSTPPAQPAQPNQPAAAQEPAVLEDPKAAAEKALRALRKKVRQAEGLVEKQKAGTALTAEEQLKAEKLSAWLQEVDDLEKKIAALS